MDANQNQDKPYKDMSPDEVYEKTKGATGKGVAAAAGAADGLKEKIEEHDLPNKAKEALQKTGETTREIAGTAVEEASRTKEHVQAKTGEGPARDTDL